MPYVPDATAVTQPDTNLVKASTASLEFQAIKLYMRDVLLAGINLKAPTHNAALTGNTSAQDLAVSGNLTVTGELRATTQPVGDASTKVATMEALSAAAMSAAMPGAASYKGMGVTSDGTNTVFGTSEADAMAILNFIGA